MSKRLAAALAVTPNCPAELVVFDAEALDAVGTDAAAATPLAGVVGAAKDAAPALKRTDVTPRTKLAKTDPTPATADPYPRQGLIRG